MNFAEYLNEVAGKDWDRMSSLVSKNSDGASVAKSIKDKEKAIDRYVAGLKLTGTELSKPPFEGRFEAFGNRAIELGATYAQIKQSYDDSGEGPEVKQEVKSWVPKKRTSSGSIKVANYSPTRSNYCPILTIGNINLKTGSSKYFNVFEEFPDGDSVYEVWNVSFDGTPKYRIIITSGTRPLHDVGDKSMFVADQSRRELPSGTMVDWGVASDLPVMAKVYGTSIPGFVYK